jgi:hypothetical protein
MLPSIHQQHYYCQIKIKAAEGLAVAAVFQYNTAGCRCCSRYLLSFRSIGAAMEVLEFTTKVNAAGRLCLDIPTGLAPGEVQVVLVLNPAAAPHQHYDFSDLAGRLAWQGDALATQRSLRDEW